MRAALGLALLFGGSVLALTVLSGRVPFGATSAPGGGAVKPPAGGLGGLSGASGSSGGSSGGSVGGLR